jgi:hypothetical protein
MLGIVTGVAIGGYSAKVFYDTTKESQQLYNDKSTLISKTFHFSSLAFQQPGSCITLIDNKSKAGLLKIIEEITQVTTRTVLLPNGTVQMETDRSVRYDECVTHGINLNMGMKKFIPPPDLTNVLVDKKSAITISAATSKGLSDALVNTYGINFVFSPSSSYVAKYYSLESKKVWAYGKVKSEQSGKVFVAECMGTDINRVANRAFAERQSDVDTKYIVSSIGMIVGAAFAASFVK